MISDVKLQLLVWNSDKSLKERIYALK